MAKTQKHGDFEYFKPTSEWKEEPENNIIILHLPGNFHHLFVGI